MMMEGEEHVQQPDHACENDDKRRPDHPAGGALDALVVEGVVVAACAPGPIEQQRLRIFPAGDQ